MLRSNNIFNYVVAGYIFEEEGNFLEAGKAFANASDDFYGEIIYLESDDEDEDFIEDLRKVAEKIYDKAIDMIKRHCENIEDIDSQILLCGLLSGGSEKQKLESKKLINKLLTRTLSSEQKDMILFIHKTTY